MHDCVGDDGDDSLQILHPHHQEPLPPIPMKSLVPFSTMRKFSPVVTVTASYDEFIQEPL